MQWCGCHDRLGGCSDIVSLSIRDTPTSPLLYMRLVIMFSGIPASGSTLRRRKQHRKPVIASADTEIADTVDGAAAASYESTDSSSDHEDDSYDSVPGSSKDNDNDDSTTGPSHSAATGKGKFTLPPPALDKLRALIDDELGFL